MDPETGNGEIDVNGGRNESSSSNLAVTENSSPTKEQEAALHLNNGREQDHPNRSMASTMVQAVGEDQNEAQAVNAGASLADREAEQANIAVNLGVRESANTDVKTAQTSSRRGSSLELRRLPVNVLLQPQDLKLVDEELSLDDAEDVDKESTHRSWLHKMCLNPKLTLRSQMLLSFGVISTLTILLVVSVCIAVTMISGEFVKHEARLTFDELSPVIEARATRYIAEELTPRLIMDDVVQLIAEAVQDRFYGYPDLMNDSQVPFYDTLSGENKYPIVGDPVPLDFQIDANVNEQNKDEHVQKRFPWYSGGALSSTNAAYYMQGMCDPAVTDPSAPTYFENCTDANNNIATGGVYAPSPTNVHVHRKASDLTPLLKSIYEYHTDLKAVSILFTNGGAGSTITYPGTQLTGGGNYTSIGCDWLKGPNPFDASKPLLTSEEIARCQKSGPIRREEGVTIPTRLYSPLDRGWFRTFVYNKGKLSVYGPYVDAWSGNWLITIGRSVHDPVTKALVGALIVDLSVDSSLPDILLSSRVTENSHVSVVAFDKIGTVTTSTAWNMSAASLNVPIFDLNVGVTQSAYEEFQRLVNYNSVWDPISVTQAYEKFFVRTSGYRVRAYPMPPVPDQYDASYRPMFLVFFSLSNADLYVATDAVENEVDERVKSLVILSIIVGAVGLGVIMITLVAVSNHITQPIRKMDETAKQIVDGFAGNEEKIVMESGSNRFYVETELSQIVREFQRMVAKFSGGALAKSAKVGIAEVDNQFQQLEEFEQLYLSRRDSSFKYKIEDARICTEEGGASATVQRVHLGSNILSGGASTENLSSKLDWENSNSRWFSSPLFKWIVGLIVIPLLLSTVAIATIVTVSVSRELPEMINVAQQGLIVLQVSALSAFATLRASFAAKISEQPIRDVHVLTRYSSWLLFGGLKGEGFPEIISGQEECKQYEANLSACPFTSVHHVCDCTWISNITPAPLPCEELGGEARVLQRNFWSGSSQDVRPNGDRNSTSFPYLAYSPNTTAWWRNPDEVPGSPETPIGLINSTSTTPRYATPYSRLRSVAAAPIIIPLFNYDVRRETIMANMIAFEADGMYLGYAGCQSVVYASDSSSFVSSEQNRAEDVRPELCPKGKYGYDPRCRGWYADARMVYELHNMPMHVTPPYVFGTSDMIGQSCASTLVDPKSQSFVGEVLVDFSSTKIFQYLSSERTPLAKGGFHVLILASTMSDDTGLDVVIGPNHSITDAPRPIGDLLGKQNEAGIASIFKSMKEGKAGSDQFTMFGPDGHAVTMHIAYTPVIVKMFQQVDASNFSRGVNAMEHKLYSFALVEPEASLLESFEAAEDDIENVIRVGVAILASSIVLACLAVVFLSHRITVSMTAPMRYLLELIRHINRLDGEDPPVYDMDGQSGCLEVLHARLTMEKLYHIIQFANASYFAGETGVAYEIYSDALALFTRLGNSKAIGVACNNLGNTMLTLYRTMQVTGEETLIGLTKRQIIGKGMSYFHQAIQLGEQAYDAFYEAEGWGPNCLDFMQHLSNRYFNRAMFLLTVKDGHERPKEIEELGLRDLQIARDMDCEIVDEGLQVGWNVRSAEAHFEVLLTRVRGHITLLELGYPDDWDVNEMLNAAFKILKTELPKESSALFANIGPAGRMQQIEFELIRYFVVKSDMIMAAKIAIRMMVEDEYVIPEAQKVAIDVLVKYSEQTDAAPDLQKRLQKYRLWLQGSCEDLSAQRSNMDVGSTKKDRRSFRGAILRGASSQKFGSSSVKDDDSTKGEKSATHSAASFRESMRGDVTMEFF